MSPATGFAVAPSFESASVTKMLCFGDAAA